ncbi:MAG TPA: WG repeat-containing protein [Bacteroidia bacterium]|jgi:hypothetical protein|nr:WG repeat-containing protein [Bacteroidia bacterium]
MPKSSRLTDILIITLFVTISIVVVLFATGIIHFKPVAGPPVKYGFLDKEGKIAIALEYDSVCDFHQGLATVYKDGKTLVIDPWGKTVDTKPVRYRIDSLNISHILHSGGDKPDPALNRNCAVVTTPAYGKTLYRILLKTGKGEEVGHEHLYSFVYLFLPPESASERPHLYEIALPYHDSLAAVHGEIGKKWNHRWFEKSWGFIDLHGEYRAKPFYCDAHSFSEGLAAVAIKMVPHAR